MSATALEIFTNPYDLEFVVGEGNDGSGKFGFYISRGPGHSFKLLLSSKAFGDKPEEVVIYIQEILRGIQAQSSEILSNKDCALSQILNPEGKELDQLEVLNESFIDRILESLRSSRRASTYEWVAAPA